MYPLGTASAERSFSAMQVCTRLRQCSSPENLDHYQGVPYIGTAYFLIADPPPPPPSPNKIYISAKTHIDRLNILLRVCTSSAKTKPVEAQNYNVKFIIKDLLCLLLHFFIRITGIQCPLIRILVPDFNESSKYCQENTYVVIHSTMNDSRIV